MEMENQTGESKYFFYFKKEFSFLCEVHIHLSLLCILLQFRGSFIPWFFWEGVKDFY